MMPCANETYANIDAEICEQIWREDGHCTTSQYCRDDARELGVMSDLQVGEILMHTSNLMLGFDATTQEGVHINSVHITDKPIVT